jgi:cytochrome c-type biogenesis protein CcsB
VAVNVSLAHTSDSLFAWAVLAYAVAMLGYAAEFAFARLDRARRRSTGRPERAGKAAVVLTLLGWGMHVASVTTRGLAAHRVPWGNMFEFSTMVALVAVTVYLVLLARQKVRYLGLFVMVPVVLYLGLAGTVLYVPAGPLQPVLDSYWIKIHVVAAITASGGFMVSGVITLLYLVRSWLDKRSATVSLGPGAAAAVELEERPTGTRAPIPGQARAMADALARWLPSSERLDRLSYQVIAFAFPVWTFAIVAGAIWAKYAWSRYWGWDPKETWSFITWVAYAAYLHARATAGWRGRRAAYLSLVGFGCLMVDYYVVNTVITGLHSYAGVN